MSWEEIHVLDQRKKLIDAWLKQEWSMTQLCEYFQISRKTGYKWIARYDAQGRPGLEDRSQAVSSDLQSILLEVRAQHPTWGPRKILAWVQRTYPEKHWPAASTIGSLLARHGLCAPKRRPNSPRLDQPPLLHPQAADDVWSADFKGWFRTQDGQICHPFTLADVHSRYVLCVQALARTGGAQVRECMEQTFREYGLPTAIRTDNGAPFASRGLGGLTRLNVWWIKLGIRPERIAPGKPTQNGRHEQMHRTLKTEAIQPAQACHRTQQQAFDQFRDCFNEQRPHAALAYRTPAQEYQGSRGTGERRELPVHLPEVVYAQGMTKRKVRHNGEIRWQGDLIFVSEALAGEWVGLEEIANGQWQLYFSAMPLAVRDRDNTVWLPPTVKTPANGK